MSATWCGSPGTECGTSPWQLARRIGRVISHERGVRLGRRGRYLPVTTFLAGGGDAGALIRSTDWSASPVGKPEGWPEALRTALAVCLNSAIPSAVYWGPDFITFYNDAWAQQQAGRHPWAMGRPGRESRAEIWDTIRPQFEEVMKSGRGLSVSNQRLPMQRGDATESWWSYSIVPLHTDGVVGGLLTQGFDTTAQVRAEQFQARQVDRMQDMFRQAPGAVAILSGPEHVFEIANEAYYALIGQRRDVIGKTMAEALPEVVEQGFVDLMDTVFRTGEPFVGRSVPVSLTRGGTGEPETRMVDFVYQPIRNPAGEVQDIFVEATDVTERVLGEAALRESEERFRLVAESAPVMLWMGDENGRCLYLNRALREFWGVPEDGVATFNWNSTVHPDDVDKLAAPFMQGMTTQTGFEVEVRYRRADGEVRTLHTTSRPRFGPTGDFLGMIGVNVDVTEMRQVSAALEAAVVERTAKLMSAEQQLRQAQKMEAIGQLTGGIAHDFNNMLAVIMGALNLMQRKLGRGETDVSRYMEGALEGARRAASLTSRLLAFSRQQQLAPEQIDANRLVQGMTDLLTRTLGEAIRVETVLSAGLWRTLADANQLESAILNLAVNARDAMEDGGRLTIETANAHIDDAYGAEYAISPGQYVLVAVTDTGVGMTAEIIAKAFDPFFTTKEVGKGTGLGLSQVFGFIRQSGGHVKIYSEPGVGTTVKVYLPRSYAESDPVERRTVMGAVAPGSGEVVLVVEDEERVRAYSCDTLRELGYSVVEARTPGEALRIIEAGHPVSLLFTDVVMPDMNGRQLADRAHKLRPDLKVLYTTGYTRNAVVHNGVLDPGTNFLPKPFTIDQLALKVRQALDS
jgi:PAS domain S-box-containing protein